MLGPRDSSSCPGMGSWGHHQSCISSSDTRVGDREQGTGAGGQGTGGRGDRGQDALVTQR